MKKQLFALLTSCIPAFFFAQQNLDFEAAVIQNSTSGLNEVPGWTTLYAFGVTSNVGEGSQSIKVVSSYDPFLANALGLDSDTVPGVAIQTIPGTGLINPQAISLDFMYKYTPYSGDRGLIYVEVADTMNAGDNDNVSLFAAFLLIPATVSNWTNHTLSLLSTGNTGTPNAINIITTSSAGVIDNLDDIHFGSTLWLDAFHFNSLQYVELNENIFENAQIYPNPFNDQLTIEVPNECTVEIIDLNGAIVAASKTSETHFLSALESGVYICEITNNQTKEKLTKRIIKQ